MACCISVMKTIWPGQQASSAAAEMNIVLLKTSSSINKTKGTSCLGKSGHQAEETASDWCMYVHKLGSLHRSCWVLQRWKPWKPRHVCYHLACAISVYGEHMSSIWHTHKSLFQSKDTTISQTYSIFEINHLKHRCANISLLALCQRWSPNSFGMPTTYQQQQPVCVVVYLTSWRFMGLPIIINVMTGCAPLLPL